MEQRAHAGIKALKIRGAAERPRRGGSGRREDAAAGEFKTLGATNRLDKPFTLKTALH